MPELIVYDKAKWHHESKDWPAGLAPDQAFVHTGLFLGWLVENELMSDEWLEDFGDLRDAFLAREKTGPVVFRLMGGSLTSDALSPDGNAFSQEYFDFEHGIYLQDYEDLLTTHLPTMYHVSDSWPTYDLLRARLTDRLVQWQQGSLPVKGDE